MGSIHCCILICDMPDTGINFLDHAIFDPLNDGSIPRRHIIELAVDRIILNGRDKLCKLSEEVLVLINNLSNCLILKVSRENFKER